MIRPRSALTPMLFASGALLTLGLAVWLLEKSAGRPSRDSPSSAAVVARPDSLPTRPAVEGLTRQRAAPTRPTKPPPRRGALRHGPLQIIVAVSDRASGKVLPSFQVTVLDHDESAPLQRLDQAEPQAFHLRQGICRIQKEPGSYDVVVLAPGYLPGVLRSVPIPAESGEALPLLLDRGPGIAGTVIDSDGLTRAGIDVFLETTSLREPGAAPPLFTKAVSGVDGRFAFSPLPPGEYTVCPLWPNNLDDRVAGLRVARGTTEVTLRLLARHQLSLRVLNNQDQPLRQARLEIRGGGHITSTATNATGVAVIDNLPDGHYEITVRQPGYRKLVDELELEGGLGQHVLYLRLVGESEG